MAGCVFVYYPDFPSRGQVREYLLSFARRHGLLEHIHCRTAVQRVEPIDGGAQWKLHFDSGAAKCYDSVVIATDHHWQPFLPAVEGVFNGRQIHSSDYRGPDIFRGKRVLIVGGGNSAADLAVAVGDYQRYGLARPRHKLFQEDPTINDSLLNDLKHGRIEALPGIRRLDGGVVEFMNGRRESYDLICWATGFTVSVPCIDKDVIAVKDNVPDVAMGMYAPRHKNLYVFGLGHLLRPVPRYGVGPMISAGADVLSLSILLQPTLNTPVGVLFAKLADKPGRYAVGPTRTANDPIVGVGWRENTGVGQARGDGCSKHR